MKRWFSLMIRIAIGIILIVVIFWSIDKNTITANLSSVRLVPVLSLCLTAIVDRVLMAYKWNLLLRVRGISISLWQATRLYFVGQLLGTFTPGAIGADVYRVTALSRFKKNKIVASTVLFERITGLAVIGIFAVVMLPISAQYLGASSSAIIWAIIASTSLAIITIFVSFRPNFVEGIALNIPYLSRLSIARKFRDFYNSYAENRFYSRILFIFTVLTALEVVVLIIINYIAAKSLTIDVSFTYFLCVMPLLHILIRLPISFQGIGVQEGLFAYFLMAVGFSAADGLSISLLLRAAEIVSIFLPACILFWLRPLRIHAPIYSK